MKTDAVPPPGSSRLAETDDLQAHIEAFTKRYGDAYLRLAYHAAFPLSLTPDLLYRLWGIVQQDQQNDSEPVPWMAVSDLLIASGFCEEVGHELYELNPALRQELLRLLEADSRFGASRVRELADFTLAYVDPLLNSPDPAERDFAQIQRWGSLAYLRPKDAARELAQALSHAYAEDTADLNRIATVVQSLSDPLKDYPSLLAYARGMARYARGDEAGAFQHFKRLHGVGSEIDIEGVTLPLPKVNSETSEPAQQTSKPYKSVPLILSLTGVAAVAIGGSLLWQTFSPKLKSSVSESEPITTKTPEPLPADELEIPTTQKIPSSPTPSSTPEAEREVERPIPSTEASTNGGGTVGYRPGQNSPGSTAPSNQSETTNSTPIQEPVVENNSSGPSPQASPTQTPGEVAPSPEATTTSTSGPRSAIVRTPGGNGINIRNTPNGRPVGGLDDGTRVPLTGRQEYAGGYTWAQLNTRGSAWVARDFLVFEGATSATPPITNEQGRYVVIIPGNNPNDLRTARIYSRGSFIDQANQGTFINVGTFADRSQAERLINDLRNEGLDARIYDGSFENPAIVQGRYWVAIPGDNPNDLRIAQNLVPGAVIERGSENAPMINAGVYSDRSQAQNLVNQLRQAGLNATLYERQAPSPNASPSN